MTAAREPSLPEADRAQKSQLQELEPLCCRCPAVGNRRPHSGVCHCLWPVLPTFLPPSCFPPTADSHGSELMLTRSVNHCVLNMIDTPGGADAHAARYKVHVYARRVEYHRTVDGEDDRVTAVAVAFHASRARGLGVIGVLLANAGFADAAAWLIEQGGGETELPVD